MTQSNFYTNMTPLSGGSRRSATVDDIFICSSIPIPDEVPTLHDDPTWLNQTSLTSASSHAINSRDIYSFVETALSLLTDEPHRYCLQTNGEDGRILFPAPHLFFLQSIWARKVRVIVAQGSIGMTKVLNHRGRLFEHEASGVRSAVHKYLESKYILSLKKPKLKLKKMPKSPRPPLSAVAEVEKTEQEKNEVILEDRFALKGGSVRSKPKRTVSLSAVASVPTLPAPISSTAPTEPWPIARPPLRHKSPDPSGAWQQPRRRGPRKFPPRMKPLTSAPHPAPVPRGPAVNPRIRTQGNSRGAGGSHRGPQGSYQGAPGTPPAAQGPRHRGPPHHAQAPQTSPTSTATARPRSRPDHFLTNNLISFAEITKPITPQVTTAESLHYWENMFSPSQAVPPPQHRKSQGTVSERDIQSPSGGLERPGRSPDRSSIRTTPSADSTSRANDIGAMQEGKDSILNGQWGQQTEQSPPNEPGKSKLCVAGRSTDPPNAMDPTEASVQLPDENQDSEDELSKDEWALELEAALREATWNPGGRPNPGAGLAALNHEATGGPTEPELDVFQDNLNRFGLNTDYRRDSMRRWLSLNLDDHGALSAHTWLLSIAEGVTPDESCKSVEAIDQILQSSPPCTSVFWHLLDGVSSKTTILATNAFSLTCKTPSFPTHKTYYNALLAWAETQVSKRNPTDQYSWIAKLLFHSYPKKWTLRDATQLRVLAERTDTAPTLVSLVNQNQWLTTRDTSKY